jgi:hypothetical protein
MAQKLSVIGRNKGKSHYWFTAHNTFRAQGLCKAPSPVIRHPNTKAVITTAVFADYVICLSTFIVSSCAKYNLIIKHF